VARSGDRLGLIDLRFGRWIRDLMLPAGVCDFAVDESFQRIALASENGLELVRPDALRTLNEWSPSAISASVACGASDATSPSSRCSAMVETPDSTAGPMPCSTAGWR